MKLPCHVGMLCILFIWTFIQSIVDGLFCEWFDCISSPVYFLARFRFRGFWVSPGPRHSLSQKSDFYLRTGESGLRRSGLFSAVFELLKNHRYGGSIRALKLNNGDSIAQLYDLEHLFMCSL